MKKAILSALIITSLASCGKKDSSTTPTPTPTKKSPIVKLKVNGTTIELNQTSVYTLTTSTENKYGLEIHDIDITKTTPGPGTKRFNIVIKGSDFVVGGTGIVGGAGNDNSLAYTTDYTNKKETFKVDKVTNKSRGTFNITKIKDGIGNTKNFYGTFSGTFYNTSGDSIVVTEGQIIE